jgi:hypothetical protein
VYQTGEIFVSGYSTFESQARSLFPRHFGPAIVRYIASKTGSSITSDGEDGSLGSIILYYLTPLVAAAVCALAHWFFSGNRLFSGADSSLEWEDDVRQAQAATPRRRDGTRLGNVNPDSQSPC